MNMANLPNPPRLAIHNLTVELDGRTLLSNVSLAVEEGHTLGLVGASGSGKSLTTLAVAGLLPRTMKVSGSIRLDGEELLGLPEERLCLIRGDRIGLVTQEPATALNPLMTIGAQIAETVRLHRMVPYGEAMRIARETLDEVGLPATRIGLDRYPHELSGGQRQRVAIAIAVAMRPALLIADEPTTALDVTVQAQILALLKRLTRYYGIALVFVSHDLAIVGQIADRIAVMEAGRVIEQRGPSGMVLADLREPVSVQLLEAARHRPMRVMRHAANAPVVLQARDLRFEYPATAHAARGHRAVDGASLELRRGESLGIVGESGCGKTTLLRLLLGLEQPQHGDVQLDGKSLVNVDGTQRRQLRRRIQAVFQDPYGSFDPRWRVERLVAEPLDLAIPGIPAAQRRQKVEAALARVGLPDDAADRFPHAFSGGQRQRIAIARALIVEPDVVALDEAISALDIFTRNQILDLLADLTQRLGIAWLFVSHDLSVVQGITDRVAVMRDGRIVETGTTAQLFADPQHPHTRELIAAMPQLPDAVRKSKGW